MAARSYGQYCGLTTAVELVGERWALLILRDLLVGPRRFTDLLRGLPRIPTNILTTRLKELQAGGVVRRIPLGGRGVTYELTTYGRALEPVLLALGRWGFASMGEPSEGDIVTPDSLTVALRTAFQPHADVPPTSYVLHVGDIVLRADVDGERLDVLQLAPDVTPVGGRRELAPPDVTFAAGPGIREVIAGSVSAADAIAGGLVHVLDGDPVLIARFATTFHIAIGSDGMSPNNQAHEEAGHD